MCVFVLAYYRRIDERTVWGAENCFTKFCSEGPVIQIFVSNNSYNSLSGVLKISSK